MRCVHRYGPLRMKRRPPRGSDGSYGPCSPVWTGRPGRPRRHGTRRTAGFGARRKGEGHAAARRPGHAHGVVPLGRRGPAPASTASARGRPGHPDGGRAGPVGVPSEKRFASWLQLVPRTAVSGGKPLRHKKTAGTGSTGVAGVLRMAALSLQRSRTALGAAFRRTARYKGGAVAIFAIARKHSTRPGSASAASTACATRHRPSAIH